MSGFRSSCTKGTTFLGFGGVLLYFTLACPDLATQATEISRLAWLILIIWAAVFGLGLPRVL